jgi:hypothetical protein
MKKTAEKLRLLDEVRAELIFPTTGTPIIERAVLNYLDQLGIKPTLMKVKNQGRERRHITEDQARQVKELFHAKHWRKFKAAEEKSK